MIYSCDVKAESLLQSSVSYDPSEINLICWLAAQETFIIIINVKKVVLLHIFVETVILDEVEQNSIYFKYKYFVTF